MKKPILLLVVMFSGWCATPPVRGLVVDPVATRHAMDRAWMKAQIQIESVGAEPDSNQVCVKRSTARILAVEWVHDDGTYVPGAGEIIYLRTLGCELGETGVFISGYPRPHKGGRYRAYLNHDPSGDLQIAGFEDGLAPLNQTRMPTRNRTDGSDGDGQGAFLFWSSSYFPLPYFISTASFVGRPDFVLAVDKSFKTWRDLSGVSLEIIGLGCSTSRKNENDGVNNVILVKSKWPFDPSAIAITRNFYVSGSGPKAGMILDSDIMINAADHEFTTTNENGKYDLQDIVTHEVGHFLGLGHETQPLDPDATMYKNAVPNETKKRNLHADDIAGIRSAYPGVNDRLQWRTPSCEVTEVASSCGAVHQASTKTPWGVFALLLLMIANILFGRVLRKRRQ